MGKGRFPFVGVMDERSEGTAKRDEATTELATIGSTPTSLGDLLGFKGDWIGSVSWGNDDVMGRATVILRL